MSESGPAESGRWAPDVAAVSLVVLAQILAVLNPELIPLDREELYNAAHGRMVQLGHIDALQLLQYRSYCGGCALNAALGAGFFAVLGPSLLAWKLVPIAYCAVAVLAGGRWLRLNVGAAAAVAFAALFVLAPPAWLELSLVGWGNHMETGCLAVVALVLTMRLQRQPDRAAALCLGLVLAIAGWIGFSSGFIGLAVLAMLLLSRQWSVIKWVGIGCLPLLAIWALQSATTPSSPFDTIYYEGERLPRLDRIPVKLLSLVAPRQLVALFGHAGDRLGWWMGWAWAAGLAWAIGSAIRAGRHGARAAVGFVGAFVLVYSFVRFTVWHPPAPHIAPPGSMRYAAPIFPLAFFIAAAAVGRAWREQRWRTVALLAVLLGTSGIRTRLSGLAAPFPNLAALHVKGPDFPYFRDQASYTLDASHHARCDADDPDIRAVHAFGAGWHEARTLSEATRVLPPLRPPVDRPADDYFEGVGELIRSRVDPRSQRGPELLSEMAARLRDQPATGLDAALREGAWRRSTDWMRIATDRRPHDERALSRIAEMTESLRPQVRRAAHAALGRRWAHDVARWAEPSAVSLPAAPLPPGFAAGLGEGLGELWGPHTEPTDFIDIPDAQKTTFIEGYSRGSSRRWLSR